MVIRDFMISIEETESVLERLADELPAEFYGKLNGGIILLPESRLNENDRSGDLYTLGEYHYDAYMGRYIAIYYGSFSKVYGRLPQAQLEKRLREVLRHEFRHHLESLAGERDLEKEDDEYISEYLRRFGG
jgi:hypothetical protein